MKVSERRTEPKKGSEVISTINKKPRQFHMIKSNKEVTPKTRETQFLYRKTRKQKLRNFFSEIVFKKFVELFFR